MVVLGREPQVAGELLAVGEQALDRCRVVGLVPGGEGVDAGLDRGHQLEPGTQRLLVLGRFGERLGVEDGPVGGLDLALGVAGTLASTLRARWIRQR